MNRPNHLLITLILSLLPSIVCANEWESKELKGVSVRVPSGAEEQQGTLRSMPRNLKWKTLEAVAPEEMAKYRASICSREKDQSLLELANF